MVSWFELIYMVFFKEFYVTIVFANFFLVILLLILNFRILKGHFETIRRSTLVILFLILCFGLYLRISVFSNSDDLNSSTWEYLAVVNCLNPKHSCPFEIQLPIPYTHPIGYPVTLASFFFLSNINITKMHMFNIIIDVLNILIIFLLVYLLFKNEKIGIFSAFIVVILNDYIVYANKGEVEIFSIMMTLLTLLVLVISLKENLYKIHFLLFSLLAYSVETRIETIAFLSLLFVTGLILFKGAAERRQTLKKWLIVVTILFVFFVPSLYFVLSHESQNPEGATFSLNHVGTFIPFFIDRYKEVFVDMLKVKWLFVICLPFSALALFKENKYRRTMLFLVLWFIFQNLAYLSFFRGPGGHFILGCAPLIIIISIGIYVIFSYLNKYALYVLSKKYKIKKISLLLVVIFLLAILFCYYSPSQILKRAYRPNPYEQITIDMWSALNSLKNDSYIIVPYQIGLMMKYQASKQAKIITYSASRREANALLILSNNSGSNLNKNYVISLIKEKRLFFFKYWDCNKSDPNRLIEISVTNSHPDCDIIDKTFNLAYKYEEGYAKVYEVSSYK